MLQRGDYTGFTFREAFDDEAFRSRILAKKKLKDEELELQTYFQTRSDKLAAKEAKSAGVAASPPVAKPSAKAQAAAKSASLKAPAGKQVAANSTADILACIVVSGVDWCTKSLGWPYVATVKAVSMITKLCGRYRRAFLSFIVLATFLPLPLGLLSGAIAGRTAAGIFTFWVFFYNFVSASVEAAADWCLALAGTIMEIPSLFSLCFFTRRGTLRGFPQQCTTKHLEDANCPNPELRPAAIFQPIQVIALSAVAFMMGRVTGKTG